MRVSVSYMICIKFQYYYCIKHVKILLFLYIYLLIKILLVVLYLYQCFEALNSLLQQVATLRVTHTADCCLFIFLPLPFTCRRPPGDHKTSLIFSFKKGLRTRGGITKSWVKVEVTWCSCKTHTRIHGGDRGVTLMGLRWRHE